MHILFEDETNDRATQDEEFFIYGGLILSENQAVGVHRGMLDIRREYDLGHHEPIKFDTNAAGAVRLGRDRWTEVKARVLDLLNEIDAKFVAYCVHHDIAAGQTLQTRNEWAIGAVLYRFNQFMYTEVQDSGIVVLDTPDIDRLSVARINDEGLTFSEDTEAAPLARAQMASFLARALNLPATATDFFVDDNGNTHEANINKAAEAAITLGCGGAFYCPNEFVTRAQMASFLARALDLPGSATDWFTDDDGNTHEDNINAIAHPATAITQGCASGLYCPSQRVTREQDGHVFGQGTGPRSHTWGSLRRRGRDSRTERERDLGCGYHARL